MLKHKSLVWISLLGVLGFAQSCAETSTCGNAVCEEGEETICPMDCPTCGDGFCNGTESSETCPDDCSIERCGDRKCTGSENRDTCPTDCRFCGDGYCDATEIYNTCPSDCTATCGNDVCETSGGETYEVCPYDCPAPERCGDGVCSLNETTLTCVEDCKDFILCGNDKCESGENRSNCPADCPAQCGDGYCDDPETEATCPNDCALNNDEYQAICGDNICDEGESESCPNDCKGHVIATKPLTMEEFAAVTEGSYHVNFDYDRVITPSDAVEGETKEGAIIRQLNDFFAFPYPSALRTDKYGRPDMKTYPLPLDDSLLGAVGALLPFLNDMIPSLVQRAQTERAGFSPIGAVYFTTSVKLDQTTKDFPLPEDTASADSCYQLINVEPTSKHYGERVPVYVNFHRTANKVWAENTLVMRPVPGVAANPGDRHVAIVGDCITSRTRKLNQSNKLRHILNKTAPKEMMNKLEFYVDQVHKLDKDGKLGIEIDRITAMTGYDMMDAAAEMDKIAADLKGKGSIVTDENGLAVGTWNTNIISSYNANVFTGTFKTINYIEGAYPYANAGEGEIRFDVNGKLKSVGKEEIVTYSIVVPKTAMPSKGYPIAVYGHGTGGSAKTHSAYTNSEGLTLTKAGVPMAMIGFDACLHADRAGGASPSMADMVMMVLNDPVVIRESWRQTVADMLVLYDIIGRGELKLPSPIKGGKPITFDPSYGLYMGHSQGSQEAGLLLGLTGDIKNAFLSAGGGGILLSFVDLRPDLSNVAVVGDILKNKTAADILGYVLGLNDGDISYDTFITTQIVQPLLDPIDPLNYTRRFIQEPKTGMTPKNIVQTIGLGDQSTPQAAQFAMISSIGLPTIGEMFTDPVPDPMRIAGLDIPQKAPASKNVTTSTGKVTAGALQFNYTGNDNPHFVIYRMNSAKQSYIEFFRTVLEGKPQIIIDGSQEGEN